MEYSNYSNSRGSGRNLRPNAIQVHSLSNGHIMTHKTPTSRVGSISNGIEKNEQVVVGISADIGDGVDDWSNDFIDIHMESCNTRSMHERRPSHEHQRLPASTSTLERQSSNYEVSSMRWRRENSLELSSLDKNRDWLISSGPLRLSRPRKSANDVRSSNSSSKSTKNLRHSNNDAIDSLTDRKVLKDISIHVDKRFSTDSNSSVFTKTSSFESVESEQDIEVIIPPETIDKKRNTMPVMPENQVSLEDDEDEDWDIEFGFVEDSIEESFHQRSSSGEQGVGRYSDLTRRRSENYNIFLRNVHEIMDTDSLVHLDEDLNPRPRKTSEEQLFQKHRHTQSNRGTNCSGEGTSTTGITSHISNTRVSLIAKYQLVDIANSKTYGVRIERYPQPCMTYSKFEKIAEFPTLGENRLEDWLRNLISSRSGKLKHYLSGFDSSRKRSPSVRSNKDTKWPMLSNAPFGKSVVESFFKQIAAYRFYKHEKSRIEVVDIFFTRLAKLGICTDDISENRTGHADNSFLATTAMEILQEAARLYGPTSKSVCKQLSTNDTAVRAFVRKFQKTLEICLKAFPSYRAILAIIELRYVCHHLVGFVNDTFRYEWVICSKLPVFCPFEPIAGDASPLIANEILQYYGALLLDLVEGNQATIVQDPNTMSKKSKNSSIGFQLCNDTICLEALILCDIQSLYEGKSALGEYTIPALAEMFELELDDDNLIEQSIDLEELSSMIKLNDKSASFDDQMLLPFLRPSAGLRRRQLEKLYIQIETHIFPLVKAKCAAVLSEMYLNTQCVGNMKVAESLAYESLHLLDSCSHRKLSKIVTSHSSKDENNTSTYLSMFNNDGLFSDLGREVLELLGNTLIKNNKYRYGVACLEAAGELYSFLNQGLEYAKLNRVLCNLTLQADDFQRALPLHENVADAAKKQGNVNEFIFLSQTLNGMWIREGNFRKAEESIKDAFSFLRESTNLLPPHFLGGEDISYVMNTGRSGTAMTSSSTASSTFSGGGSTFNHSTRSSSSRSSSCGEIDAWLTHDITLHLLLRDIYRASGRCLEGMKIIDYLLHYSVRLPRGKRTLLRMMMAEDALGLRIFDTCSVMFMYMDQEASRLCDKANLGGSSGNSRSKGKISGSEARYCFEMVFSIRYIMCRAKLYLKQGRLSYAFAWLALAHVKGVNEDPSTEAKLYSLEGRVFFELYTQHQQERLGIRNYKALDSKQTTTDQVSQMVSSFSTTLYCLSREEKEHLNERMKEFCASQVSIEDCWNHGLRACWNAIDQFEALDDEYHKLKALLDIIKFYVSPFDDVFFALGSSRVDSELQNLLARTAGSIDTPEVALEKARKRLLEAQKLERRAIQLAEQLGDPYCNLRVLLDCSSTWIYLDRLSSYKPGMRLKESVAFWEEAVKLIKAVFLRRVTFEPTAPNSGNPGQMCNSSALTKKNYPEGTFSLVPILNFGEGFIVKLSTMVFRLILTANQFQLFDNCPEYVNEVIDRHMDELVSARLCLSSIIQQLKSFRNQQPPPLEHPRALSSRSISSNISDNVPGLKNSLSYSSSSESASFTSSSRGLSLPLTPEGVGRGLGNSFTPQVNFPSGNSRKKGHKKNQSMSSIHELLTSNSRQSSSGHFSYLDSPSALFTGDRNSTTRNRAGLLSSSLNLGGKPTPRTGLASLSDSRSNSQLTQLKLVTSPRAPANSPRAYPSKANKKLKEQQDFSHNTNETKLTPVRTRKRSQSAPQQFVADGTYHESDSPITSTSVKTDDEPRSENVLDLGNLKFWSSADAAAILSGHESIVLSNVEDESTNRTDTLGVFDFDYVESERLWWMFNSWKDARRRYSHGKLELSAFRYHNIRGLRLLLDAFDPSQVAVLSGSNSFNAGNNGLGMLGFDVAHVGLFTLLQEKSLVLSLATAPLPVDNAGIPGPRFKVFATQEAKLSPWLEQLPSAGWYLRNSDIVGRDISVSGDCVLRTLRSCGPTIILKAIIHLLFDEPLIVIGTSFPQVQDVTLCLIALLQPFSWRHPFLPFLPVTSWRFLFDLSNQFCQSQRALDQRTKRNSSKWSGAFSHKQMSSPKPPIVERIDNSRRPLPFLLGTISETWYACKRNQRDGQIPIDSNIQVLDLDNLKAFEKSSVPNSAELPRKMRKHVMDKFEKGIKQRRKSLIVRSLSSGSNSNASQHLSYMVPNNLGAQAVIPSPAHSDDVNVLVNKNWNFSETDTHQGSLAGTISRHESDHIDSQGHRYDINSAIVFGQTVLDLYSRIATLAEEQEKKLKGKKHSRHRDIRSWFSSTRETDPFVERFRGVSFYEQCQKSMHIRKVLSLSKM